MTAGPRFLVVAALLVISSTGLFAIADGIQVTPVVKNGQVSASFTAASTFDRDIESIVQSGLLVTLTFTVELRKPSSIWFDHTLGSATVASSVKYDNLTGVYQVSKLVEGRVVWSERTQEEAKVRNWMTTFERVLLEPGGALEPNSDYYVRVRMQA